MATELDHTFTTTKPIDQSWAAITDLGRLVPCVQGGRVLEKIDDSNVKAEIVVKMGAMAMEFGSRDVPVAATTSTRGSRQRTANAANAISASAPNSTGRRPYRSDTGP